MGTTHLSYSDEEKVNPVINKHSTLEIIVERSSDHHIIWRNWLRVPLEEQNWNTTSINQTGKETIYCLPQAGTGMTYTEDEHDTFFH